ncbi:BTB/POZ fold domain containing protein [Beauveria brongniartii RCEF 3172]|uniref:BTB/POZ fold domain containing protein n=1 Tax=Beauveria brongniartii RCEF 3172 TaxID=1081107 RepID=A0A167HLD4_9HYPO|nr:BTB/POZ fold domain containing protein [Beauveria brongniartii RCEF 3172]
MDAFTLGSVRRFRQFLYTKDYDTIKIQDEGTQPADNATADHGSKAASAASAASATDSTNRAISAARGFSLDGEVDHPAARDPTFRTILAHTRMNAMGDYFDVPELVKFANARVNAALSGASLDAPWVAGLPYIVEAALEIVNNEGLTEILTTGVSERIGTILTMGTLEGSPLMTPFSLELLKKCNATSLALSKTLSEKDKLLNKAYPSFKSPADRVPPRIKAMLSLGAIDHCQDKSCVSKFDGCRSNRLRGRI